MGILGVDVGGTFTDAVLVEDGRISTAKVPTARRQEESVLAAARAVGARDLERFLPLDGWVFSRRVNLLTGSDGVARLSFRAPTIGRWRFRSFFRGTEKASPSSSGYLVVTVRS